VSNATKENSVTQSDMDYYLMVTSMCNNLPHKKMKLMARFLTESMK
jgi:hypothetical protein